MEFNQLKYYVKLKTIVEAVERGFDIPSINDERLSRIRKSINILERKHYTITPKKVD